MSPSVSVGSILENVVVSVLLNISPSYTFNLPSDVSYQSCPLIGLFGALTFEKFSNNFIKFSLKSSP